ncbi:MAG: AI-2E family transporter [Ruminococcus sp.]|nr:AI-2E family transporter [Ruminococcus sp.]
MKIYTNKKYHTIAFYAAGVLAFTVFLVLALFNIGEILKAIESILTVLNPVIWGVVIAFLLNPMMMKIEKLCRKLFYKDKQTDEDGLPYTGKLLRAISVSISSLVFLGILFGLVAIVVPELINSVMDLFGNASTIADSVQKWITKVFKNYPSILKFATKTFSDFNTDFSSIIERIQPMLENILSGAWGVVTVIKNFLLGFIVSLYMLCSKEKLLAQTKKLMIAVFKRRNCERIMNICGEANRVFSGFISGKIVDSMIIGIICFVGLTIMDMPYNIMISVVIGVTNVIPFFGPFIGAIPTAIIILITDPHRVILFLIFVVVLQQFDGNILGPKILGDSTGLPGFWVLISLLVMSGFFGFAGMVFAVPVFALAYTFTRNYVEQRLKKKKLPTTTDYYKKDIAHLYSRPTSKKPLSPEELAMISIPSNDEVNEVLMELREKSMDPQD